MNSLRAWDPVLQKMVYDFGEESAPLQYYLLFCDETGLHLHREGTSIECELMLSTGLKDKKGKEIYAEDILRIEWLLYPDDKIRRSIEFVSIEAVRWSRHHAALMLWSTPFDDSDDGRHFGRRSCVMEVIGNTYQNPELVREVE